MGVKIIAKNKRARYDYFLEENFEAGVQLSGTEIKAIRQTGCSITETHVSVDARGEVWLNNMYIPHYKFGNVHNHEERRKRKLLLNRSEIVGLQRALAGNGRSVVALSVYLKKGRIKVEIAIGKGKREYDKRQELARRDVQRKIRRGDYD